jgi:predicted SnoaL-like aldol condensation-catalyzing enzyme
VIPTLAMHHQKGDRGAGVVHIFRFDGDKLVELWDLGQEVPAESPNASGMF